MQRPDLPNWPIRLLHAGGVIAGWIVFGWFWWKVLFVQPQPFSTTNLGLLIASAFLIMPLITLAWVVHNRGIYARKGPRLSTVSVLPAYTRDWTGSAVHADFTQLKTSARIVIERSPAGKHFRSPDQKTAHD